MKIAGTDVVSSRVGSSEINAIRIGSQTVWERTTDILSQLQPTGASAITAGYDNLPAGVASSHEMAGMDTVSVSQFIARFEVAAGTYDIPMVLLAAIVSRETRGGTALDANCEGDSGNAVGIMQIDKRYYTPVNAGIDCGSQGHINQATSILAGYRTQAAVAHPEWTAAQQLQAGVAAYNGGPDVFTYAISAIDTITDGGDYSNDVIARAQYYKNVLQGYLYQSFSPETYGAVGNGVADDTAAFQAMRAAIWAAQESQPNLQVTINFATNAHYAYSWNEWSKGIRYLTVEGNNATIQNVAYKDWHTEMMTWYTNAGVFGSSGATTPWYFINTSEAGSWAVSLKTQGDASNFTVGQWIVIASYSQQTGGWPPNARYFDYAKVASIYGAVIELDRPTTHRHRDDWPSRDFSEEIDAAVIIPLERDYPWAVNWVVRNLNALPNPNWVGGGVIQIEGFYFIEFFNVNFPRWSGGAGRELLFRNSTFEWAEPDKLLSKLRMETCTGKFSQCTGVDRIEFIDSTSTGINFMGRSLLIDGCNFHATGITGPPDNYWSPLNIGGFTPVYRVDVVDTTFNSADHPQWPALVGSYSIERELGSTGFAISGNDILVDINYAGYWALDGLSDMIYEGTRLMLIASDRTRKGYGDVVSIRSNGAPHTARITVQWSTPPANGDIVIKYAVMELVAVNCPLIDTYVDDVSGGVGSEPNRGIAYNMWNGTLVKDVWTITPP